jgi:hypothetical protein
MSETPAMRELEAARRVVRAARYFWCNAAAGDALMAAVRDYDACVAQLAEAPVPDEVA